MHGNNLYLLYSESEKVNYTRNTTTGLSMTDPSVRINDMQMAIRKSFIIFCRSNLPMNI